MLTSVVVLGLSPTVREKMGQYRAARFDLVDRMNAIESRDDFRAAVALAMKAASLREAMLAEALAVGHARGGPEWRIEKRNPADLGGVCSDP